MSYILRKEKGYPNVKDNDVPILFDHPKYMLKLNIQHPLFCWLNTYPKVTNTKIIDFFIKNVEFSNLILKEPLMSRSLVEAKKCNVIYVSCLCMRLAKEY